MSACLCSRLAGRLGQGAHDPGAYLSFLRGRRCPMGGGGVEVSKSGIGCPLALASPSSGGRRHDDLESMLARPSSQHIVKWWMSATSNG